MPLPLQASRLNALYIFGKSHPSIKRIRGFPPARLTFCSERKEWHNLCISYSSLLRRYDKKLDFPLHGQVQALEDL